MAAPTPLGIVTLTSGGGTITVPSGATGAVAFWGEYGCFSGMTTFTSSFATANTADRYQTPSIGGTHNGTGLWAFDVTATGSQSFAPTWSGAPIQGPALSIAFFKDLDAGWKSSGRFATSHNQYSTTGGSVTAETDAYILVFETQDGGSAPSVPSGRTLVQNRSENAIGGVLYYVNSPTAGSNTITSGNSNFPGIAIASIKGASGGGGSQNLTVPLLTRSKALYAPTVTRGAVSISPPLLTRSKALYAPSVTPGAVSIAPPLLTRGKTLYAPVVTQGGVTLQPPLLTRSKTLYAPTVAPGPVTISPVFLTRSKTVFSPVVSPGGVTTSPPLLTRAKTLYSPSLSVGSVTLLPPLISRAKALYPPTVAGQGTISPPLLTRAKVLYAPTVTPGSVSLVPPLLTRVKALYAPTVIQAASQSIFPPLLVRDKTVFAPTVSDGSTGSNLTQAAPGLTPKIWPGLSIRYEGKPKQRVEELDEEERERIEEIAEQAVIDAAAERTKKAMKASLQASMRAAEIELAAKSYLHLVEQAALLRAEQIEEEDIAVALLLM